jgi:uncharacterized membrane protein YhhN
MMLTLLFWLTILTALVDWIATWRGWRNVRWVSKPGTLLLLLAWFTQVGGWQGVLLLFGLALVFSLLGDILLHLPERYFVPGIGAFFIAQCFYIAAFNTQPLALYWPAVLPVIAVGGIFSLVIHQIQGGMQARNDTQMVMPVTAYAVVLSLMWLSAISTLFRPGWQVVPAALVAAGAGLFFLSDTTIAYTRFVKPSRYGNILVMSTYHTGQMLITAGALMQFA